MKTLKLTLISFSIIVLLQSCVFNGITGSGNVTSESRTLTEAFTCIDVSQGIDVYFTQDDHTNMSVEMDDNLHELLVTEVKDGKLDIYFSENVGKRKSSKIFLSAPHLTEISTSSGADFKGENTIKADDISLDSSSGSDIDLKVLAHHVNLSSSSGSDIEIEGSCDYVTANASSGSDIDASELESPQGEAYANSGADIKINITKELKAKATSGSDIVVKGHPEQTDIEKSSGGKVVIK
ncbi:MAG: DUF2807 domain-containing protein [Flavobacteriia bacterium]|nr:MAG: DUF2807 domain-containing protein [Flavobacteriia bacterium]